MAHLGTLKVFTIKPAATKTPNLDTYVVRQIRVIFRQMWPSHGQRFPQ